MSLKRLVYPFSAIVGQERLKLSLILNAINPQIGGVLLTGTKGTGKSLIVRALEDILPESEIVKDCPFNCNPFKPTNMCNNCRSRFLYEGTIPTKMVRTRIIELPLGSTEEMIIGALDTEKALHEGVKALHPGLLAKANQNILYIDNVNLLPDHLINYILDPAALGWNVIQREGISISHPSRFTLIASMNPEEGDLRPQILDRFAFHAQAETLYDPKQRIEIMERNMAFERDPITFCKMYERDQENLRSRIRRARENLPDIHVPESVYESVARICSELNVDGHRPDIVAIKAAKALAAFNGRPEVRPEEVLTVSKLALSHRTRKAGLETPASSQEIRGRLEKAFSDLKIEVVEVSEKSILEPKPIEIEEGVGELSRGLLNMESKRTVKRRRLPRWIFLLTTPLVLLMFVYMMSSFILLVYFSIFGMPPGGITSAFAFRNVLPLMAIIAIISSILFLLLKQRKPPPSPIFFYQTKGGKRTRTIVPTIFQSKKPPIAKDEGEQLIAVRGAYIQRLYKAIVEYGNRIAKSLRELKEKPREGFRISLEQRPERARGSLTGKRIKTITSGERGRYVFYEFPKRYPWDIAFSPTIRAAAPYQVQRRPKGLYVRIEPQDIRVKVRETRAPLSMVLLLDMSGSMVPSLENVREAVLTLHDSVHRRKDRIGLVIFKGSDATIIQNPTTNLDLVVKKLLRVGASDFTPMAAGMLKAFRLLQREKRRNKGVIPILVIISDGIVNVPLTRPLSPVTRKMFINPSQADVIDVAHLLAKDKIRTVVVNTDHRQEDLEPEGRAGWWKAYGGLCPAAILLEIPRITGGHYYGISEGGKIQSIILKEAITTTPTGNFL